MLQCIDEKIVETMPSNSVFTAAGLDAVNCMGMVSGSISGGNYTYAPVSVPTIWWNQYPVYVCTDKTAKAIEVLKKLQAEKHLDVKSVPRFIELVEMIASIL